MPAEIFEPQINELAKKYHVIALDPRSQGDSDKAAEGNFPERHAQDIKELMDAAHVQGAVLLGWSNGVPDVLTFADMMGTDNLRGLILVDGLLNTSDPQMQKAMQGMLNMLQQDRKAFTDGFVRSMYSTPQPDAYIKRVEEMSLKTPTNTAVTEMVNVVMKGDFTSGLAKIDKPVMYIGTTRLESQGKLLRNSLPAARVEVVKDAGHAIFVDKADEFNRLVTEFMESLPAVKAGAPAKADAAKPATTPKPATTKRPPPPQPVPPKGEL
jgi:microsomal epoxide hydrolase